ncbi:hypothetical protein [Arthrobacter mobilis]|uniref:Uncharacterized protein n=1 Tax=Arthrobacter mobilis TaxID=2724944 RepID=A0A7X6K732_9MICC|nr:hypothetical protein [Arthrobacter mobilis]NKX56346.1 hypothetical protein [Arthrobacter mobilis]
MKTTKKAVAGAVLAGPLMFAAGAAPANAQVVQDGLVNVNVGDVTILQDVRIAVAANVVAQICGLNVGPVILLAQEVDATGTQDTVCKVDNHVPIIIRQNEE